uniref:Reverse transcriptase Ty1/copia-type domain-containing protein n=1 Tax=Tanacetum cinerariifolium TaxID=118510 RepID=A0A699H0Z5_TANCI|nr:hypothetical protein [Tanacetum cinerariifolium]
MLVAQGHTQEVGINYEEVFAPVARIEAIRLFLAYASFMRFTVYQMDVKSAFLYGTFDEEVYVMQPSGFPDPKFTDRFYKVEKAMGTIDQTLFIRKHRGDFILVQVYVDDIIFGSSNLQLCREFEALMHDKFYMSAMGELNFFLGLQVLQKKDGIFLLQDKYVGDILKKFGYSDVKSANTPMDKKNPWGKDGPVKRIFKYLKGHPKLRLWYPKESSFDLVAYSDSDYGGATQDRKSTTRGCQFLGRRLISWQCKKQTIVATFTTEAEYVAAASGCGQVLWIQNQLLDYGDRYEKKLISVDHIPTDDNVADLLTKPFDAGRFHPSFSGRTVPLFATVLVTQGEGSETLTEPHHTPSPEAQHSPLHDSSSPSHPTETTETLPTSTPTTIPTLRQYFRRATRIAQSKALPTFANEPGSLFRDDSKG